MLLNTTPLGPPDGRQSGGSLWTHPVLLDHVDLGYRGLVDGLPDTTPNEGGPDGLGNGVQNGSRRGPGIGRIPGIQKGIDRFRTQEMLSEREVDLNSTFSLLMTPFGPLLGSFMAHNG